MIEIKSSKTKLFLIELIVVIFFFAISSVVCVNLFANARLMSLNSTETTNAMLRAQAAAEMFRGGGDPRSAAGFNTASANANGYTVYYDRSWAQIQDEGLSAYQMDVAFSEEARLIKASITVQKGGAELFHIDTARYLGPRPQIVGAASCRLRPQNRRGGVLRPATPNRRGRRPRRHVTPIIR